MAVEVTWSLLHPRKPDPAYLREAIAAAAAYQVHSFELCGEAHLSSGSIDGAILFRDYPAATARIDRAAADEVARLLRESTDVAHASGRPVLYWHREVMVPRAVIESVPDLRDENGEFDLLGDAYRQLLASKIREFFDRVPQLDGLVLTLTESNYSVIHNSNPERYPPAKVVAAVVSAFGGELARLGKRFVLRSFGSIAQDYRDILAGAELAARDFVFEVETKITPYDFSPFLPLNPFLRRTPGAELSAEYDSIGEFLGAGYLPAADPSRVIECVRHAQAQGVDRHVIRVDRIGHATFSSTQAINLLAFDRAIGDASVTARGIWAEWAASHWPDCPAEMTAVMRTGIEMVQKTHFIDGHLIFHAFPIDPAMKWIKAAGILAVFSPGASLHRHDGMWGIDATKTAPTHAALLAEKDEAVALADAGVCGVESLRSRLSADEYALASRTWRNGTIVTRLIRAWCRCLCAYVEDIIADRESHPTLDRAIRGAEEEFISVLPSFSPGRQADVERIAALAAGNEYGGRERGDAGIEQAYAAPLWTLIHQLPDEFAAEYAERTAWRSRTGLIEFVVCGGIVDDHRVRRYMHASHAQLRDGRPARAAGNRVFPNGFIEVDLCHRRDRNDRLLVRADAGPWRRLRVVVDGNPAHVTLDDRGEAWLPLPRTTDERISVRIEKVGADYPWVFGIGTIAGPS